MIFWKSDRIDSRNCIYNIVIGERSNGKTTEILLKILTNYLKDGSRGAILRRLEMEIKGHRGNNVWSGVVDLGFVSDLTDGEYDSIIYKGRAFYLSKFNEDLQKHISSHEPFCFMFALTQAASDKSSSYPNVTTIMFDEFLHNNSVLIGEFDMFQSIVSTIVRQNKNAKVYLLGNTVATHSVYFTEMGITNTYSLELGTINEYTMYDPKTEKQVPRIAVERCYKTEGGKESDVYFTFNTRASNNMIVDGAWEMANFPKVDMNGDFKQKDVKRVMYFLGPDIRLKGLLIKNRTSTYVLVSIVPIDKVVEPGPRDYVYSLDPSTDKRTYVNPHKSYGDKFTRVVSDLFSKDKVFFTNNHAGELLKVYTGMIPGVSYTNR